MWKLSDESCPLKYSSKKLSATFYDRKNYLCHGMNLKYYLDKGLELVKIHRVISFQQEKFIEPYIEMCTSKRANSKTKFEGLLYKLYANSVYGKMIQGVANRMDCKFNYTDELAARRFNDPLLMSVMI